MNNSLKIGSGETIGCQLLYEADEPLESNTTAATEKEVRNYVYSSYTNRIKGIKIELTTIVRSNREESVRETININQNERAPKAPTLEPPNTERKKDSFIALQSWEGYVQEVQKDNFFARLTDLKNGQDEDATIPVGMVSFGDRPLLQNGAVFYWSIGQQRDWSGQIQTTSELRFKRLNCPTEADIKTAEKEGKMLAQDLGFITKNEQSTSSARG